MNYLESKRCLVQEEQVQQPEGQRGSWLELLGLDEEAMGAWGALRGVWRVCGIWGLTP